MSGHHPPPGPGQPTPPPGWQPHPPPGTPAPPPAYLGHGGWAPPPTVHRPGVVPLRPLGLGDLYDGAFRTIRQNPRSTVGPAVVVAAGAMLPPVLVTALVTWAVGFSLDASSSESVGDADAVALVSTVGSLALGSVLQAVGLLLVSGMVAHVVAAAVVGRRLSLGEAWAATRGKRWRLVGLALLVNLVLGLVVGGYVALAVLAAVTVDSLVVLVLLGLLSLPVLLAVLAVVWVRVYYLPVPVLMLEDVGVLGAVARGYRLTRGHFWRTFGIGLLTLLVTAVASGLLSGPVALGSQVLTLVVDPGYAPLVLVLGQALGTVVASAFVGPFSVAVTSLQYVDLRMRKEAFDVELVARAGTSGS